MTGPPERMRPAAARRLGWSLALLALVVYVSGAGGSLTSTDAVVTFDVTRNLVEHGSVAMSDDLLGMAWHQGTDGRYYAPFGIGQSLANVPPYLAARAFLAVSGLQLGKPDTIPKAFVALGQTVIVAALVWLVYAFGVAVTGNARASALGALTLAFGTILWPYAGFGFNQPLAAVTLLACLADAVAGVNDGSRPRLARSGAWLAASLLTRHEMALAAVPVAAWIAWSSPRDARWRRLAAFAPGVLAGLAVWMMFNAARFGSPLDSGYLDDPVPGIGHWTAGGLAGLLVSPGASVFVYSPAVVAGLAGLWMMSRSPARRVAWLLLSVSATFLLFYGSLTNWIGGRSYGSRYLVVVVPLTVLGFTWILAQWPERLRRLAFGLVCGIGVLIQIPGVVVDYAKVSQAVDPPFTTEQRQWAWAASPLVLNATAAAHGIPENVAYVVGLEEPPPPAPPAGDNDRSFSQQFAFSLDLWWLYLFYLGALPRAALWAVIVGLGLACAATARAVARQYAAEPVAYNRPV